MKCSICEKEIKPLLNEKEEIVWDSGNNAEPINSGRCCDECNMKIVLPARLEKQSIESLNYSTEEATPEEINTNEVYYRGMGIPPVDRLRNYQLTKKYWTARMEQTTEDDFINKEDVVKLKAYWKNSFKQSMEEAKPFVIEDDVIPLLLHTQSEEENLPFPSVFIDAKVQIKNRTYFGFHIGSYYTEKTKYKAILTSYSKYVKHKGEMVKILIPDFIILRKNTNENLPFRKSDYYHNQVRNFVNSFCSFINEPDVIVRKMPLNPKNNLRRAKRGVMPLPEYKNVTIRGKLKIYVDKLKQEEERESGTHYLISYRFWVRGFYRHFRDKKKYKNLYALNEKSQKEIGFTFSPKYEGILRVWIKPFIKGQGLLIKQSWEVKE